MNCEWGYKIGLLKIDKKFSRTCRVHSHDKICRDASDDCDLVEFCDGQQPDCPPDVYKVQAWKFTMEGSQIGCNKN